MMKQSLQWLDRYLGPVEANQGRSELDLSSVDRGPQSPSSPVDPRRLEIRRWTRLLHRRAVVASVAGKDLPISESLRVATKRAWVDAVLADFDTFLVDHAACERKAAATGMAFVVRYPDRPELLGPCIAFAREELEHFERIYQMVAARGLQLAPDTKDQYVVQLGREVRGGGDDRLLDRLLVAGVIEQRGRERFGLLAAALDDEDLRELYTELMHAEARHHGLFLRLASLYFDPDLIGERLAQLLDAEAVIIDRLPIRPALH